MSLENKTVWITGASSGIGEALARECAARQARVVVSARRQDRLHALVSDLPRSDQHIVLPLDVTDMEAVREAASSLLKDVGTPDILIANAGIGQLGSVLKTDPDVERQIMEVNFFGVTNVTHQVLPSMVRQGSGQLVVVSSVMGKLSTPGHATYAASKHALHGYFEGLRAELHGTGVGVTLICPGYIRTEISVHSLKGSGAKFGKIDAKHRDGMPSEKLASKAMNSVERGKSEVLIGGPETLAVYLYRFLPGLFRRLLPHVMDSRK